MTLEQKKLLEPFGNAMAGMYQMVRGATDDELAALRKAVIATSTTNCWCCTYDAGKWLLPEIGREILARKARHEAPQSRAEME